MEIERRNDIITTITLFAISGYLYLIFELYAPYCAKHTCGSSTGGYWALVPLIILIFFISGMCWLLCNVVFYDNYKN